MWKEEVNIQRERDKWGSFRPWSTFTTPSWYLLFYVPTEQSVPHHIRRPDQSIHLLLLRIKWECTTSQSLYIFNWSFCVKLFRHARHNYSLALRMYNRYCRIGGIPVSSSSVRVGTIRIWCKLTESATEAIPAKERRFVADGAHKAIMLKYLSHKLHTEANTDGNNVQEKVRNNLLNYNINYSCKFSRHAYHVSWLTANDMSLHNYHYVGVGMCVHES